MCNFEVEYNMREVQERSYIDILKLFETLSEKVRREGLLLVCDELDEYERFEFFRIGLQLVIDGTDRYDLIKILNYDIESRKESIGNYKEDIMIKLNMIKEGLLCLHMGNNPIIIVKTLFSMIPYKERTSDLLEHITKYFDD